MHFEIPGNLLDSLRQRRESRPADEIETREDAFLLHPGLGPALYLTSDGRILRDGREWGDISIVEGTDDDAVAAIVIGAENWSLPELLKLLPTPPCNAVSCSQCEGSRWWSIKDYYGKHAKVICPACGGYSWLSSNGVKFGVVSGKST